MKVFAVHERTRATIALYVELENWVDGGSLYLTNDPDGDRSMVVAAGAEPPVYMRLGLHLAPQIAAAIMAEPSDGFEVVTLSSWRDFVDLVERVSSQEQTLPPSTMTG